MPAQTAVRNDGRLCFASRQRTYSMLQLVSKGTGLPWTTALDDVKTSRNTNVGTAKDQYYTDLIGRAVDYIERETGKILRPETWRETVPCFPFARYYPQTQPYAHGYYRPYYTDMLIALQLQPVVAVSSVKYFTDNGVTLATMSPSDYYLVNGTFVGGYLAPTTIWPYAYPRLDAVQITYTVGWDSTTLPYTVRQLVMLLCGDWDNLRENEVVGTIHSAQANGVERILNQIRCL